MSRGRPKKEVEKEEEKTLSQEELIAKLIADAMAQKEIEFNKKLEEKEKEIIEKYESNSNNKNKKNTRRKFIPDESSVMVISNVRGGFTFKDVRGNGFYLRLNGYGDTANIKFKDLKNFHSSKHTFLQRGVVRLIDVVSQDDNIEIEDVIKDLNLSGVYSNPKTISPNEIEYYLLEETDINEFAEKLNNSTSILETIIEVSNILYKQGRFTDNSKMVLIRQISGKYNLFTK